MTPLERQLSACDAVAADIKTNWGTPAFTAAGGDVCQRSYSVAYDFANAPPVGRKVHVFPEPDGAGEENLAKQVDGWRFGVRVLVIERYTGSAAEPPQAWIDERAKWAEGQFDRLRDEGRPAATGDAVRLNDLDAEEGETLYSYDPDLLAFEKAFSACYRVTFSDQTFDE